MTREKLGYVLSAQTLTRTIATKQYEGLEVTDNWKVALMYVENGVLVIECEPPKTRKRNGETK